MRTLDEKPGVLLLSGGVGGARLARGFSRLEEWDTTVVVNTGDDDWVYGVYVAPDLDTVVYTLAEAEGPQGWGLVNETWQVMESLSGFPIDTTFRLGDRDLATNLFRTMRIGEGKPLSLITEEIAAAFGLGIRLLPATDHPLRTKLRTIGGEWLDFRDYFVRRQHRDRIARVRFDGAAAAAYAATWRHLLALTFDELPEGHEAPGGSRFMEVVKALLDSPEDPWWDRTGTEGRETRDVVLHQALEDAHAELVELMGNNPDRWRWGDIHTGVFNNASLGESGVSLIESVFNRRSNNISGGSGIVNATQWIASEGYETDGLPSFRMVIDLGDPDSSLSIHAPGQSGHAYHPHYDDLLEPWAAGEMHPFPWDRDTVESLAESTLVLRPGP